MKNSMSVKTAREIIAANDTSSQASRQELQKAKRIIQNAKDAATKRKATMIAKKVKASKEEAKKVQKYTKKIIAAPKAVDGRVILFSCFGYAPIAQKRDVFVALTFAAFIAAKYIELQGQTIKSGKLGAGLPNVFKAITASGGGKSSTAFNYWKKLLTDDQRTLREEGIAKLSKRLLGEAPAGYNTSPELISQMLKAVYNGGEHEIGGIKAKFKPCVDLNADVYEGKGLFD